MKFVQNLDIFGVNFQFTFNKNFSYQTKFSVILSIILIILVLGFTVLNLINMFNRNNLNINVYRSFINTNETLILNESNSFIGLDFTFGLENRKDINLSKFFKIVAQNYNLPIRLQLQHHISNLLPAKTKLTDLIILITTIMTFNVYISIIMY